MELSSDNILTSSVTLYVHKKKSHHLPVGVCFHSKISWECQESTCLWPWWKVNSAVLVQPATHQAPRQICPALQGKEWKTDGSTESWEKEVGQDVLKGDKQWGRKVEGRQQPSRLRTVETFLICLMENLPVGAVSNFMEELQIFQRLSPLSQNSEDTAGNKQIPWQQRRLPCLSVPSPSRFLQLHLQTVQQLVVRCESFFFWWDQSQLAPLWHETPSWLSDGFMFFHPLYGLQYYSNYNVYCAVTLSQNYELMQRLEGLHESPVCFADFSTKFCVGTKAHFTAATGNHFSLLFFPFFSNNYWEKKR